MLTLEARPAPIAIEAERAAVLVVDMQNDFGAPGGMFDRAGIDITMIRRVIEPISRVLVAARRAHVPVIYLKMEHQPDLSDAGAADSPHRIKHGPISQSEDHGARRHDWPKSHQGYLEHKNHWGACPI
jgi:ureidoacrylate peracid hydrolase